MSCDSWESNAQYDVVPPPLPGDHLNPIACYLGEHMEKYLTHPYASPLFGDFSGLPPLLIQAGDSEVLRDEITLLAHKATLAGVTVRHELYEDAVCVSVHASLHYGLWYFAPTGARLPNFPVLGSGQAGLPLRTCVCTGGSWSSRIRTASCFEG